MAKISVIIPNFNGRRLLPSCLKSLNSAIINTSASRFEVILCDNGSTDTSRTFFRCFCRRHRLNHQCLHFPSNLGFSAAVNQGIRHSSFDYVCLLNNDIQLDPLWFSHIINHLSDKYHIYCGSVIGTNHLLESAGIDYDFRGRCLQRFHHQTLGSLPPSPFPVWGSSAAAVVYLKSALTAAGGFDNYFFAYVEDVDLSFRLHRLGYHTLCLPQSISSHLGGSTSNKFPGLRQYYTFRNWQILILKNYTPAEFCRYFFSIIAERLANLRYLIFSQSLLLLPRTLFKIYWDIFFHLPAIIEKRRRFQNLLKLSHDHRH